MEPSYIMWIGFNAIILILFSGVFKMWILFIGLFFLTMMIVIGIILSTMDLNKEEGGRKRKND